MNNSTLYLILDALCLIPYTLYLIPYTSAVLCMVFSRFSHILFFDTDILLLGVRRFTSCGTSHGNSHHHWPAAVNTLRRWNTLKRCHPLVRQWRLHFIWKSCACCGDSHPATIEAHCEQYGCMNPNLFPKSANLYAAPSLPICTG